MASAEPTRLKFTLNWKASVTNKTYAMMAIYYYGRFTEEILSHFDRSQFSNVGAPPFR